MLTIESARAPRWTDEAHTTLELYVTFEEYKATLGEIPYTAHASDDVAHGRELFERAEAGDFGTIATYVEPVLSDEHKRALWKAERQQLVDAIKVETRSFRVFDGNEVSQDRMARAIVSLMGQPKATVLWVLADNSYAYVDAAELSEALNLARARQSELWLKS